MRIFCQLLFNRWRRLVRPSANGSLGGAPLALLTVLGLELAAGLGCPAKPDHSLGSAAPSSVPVAQSSRPSLVPAAAPVPRDNLDAFVASIVAAAEAHDFGRLETLMDPDFEIAMIDSFTVEAILSQWREEPAHLDRLAEVLRGPCVFLDTRQRLLCPRALTGLEEWGDAVRVHLETREDGWHWTSFITGDPSVSLISESSSAPPGPPSVSPVFTAPQPPPALGMDQDVIRRIVRAHIDDVRYCYNLGLVDDPQLAGRVVIQFTIAPDGSVPVAVVVKSTVPDGIGACIAAAMEGWRFPEPISGGNAVVTYPFVLSPG